MDRRQKKTREAIFKAFSSLLQQKHYTQITVGEIIALADIGRATFYAHFATKDFLLRELCEELFCHIFDVAAGFDTEHKHIFECDTHSTVILHLLEHLEKNDNHILELLACENNELFLRYFKENFKELIIKQSAAFENRKPKALPDELWLNYVSTTFVETVRWWVSRGKKESIEMLAAYYATVV